MLKHNVKRKTFSSSQTLGSEKVVSSSKTFGPKGKLGERSVAMDDVKMTLLTEDTLEHVSRTFIVPLTAGSISSACKIHNNY